MFSYKTSVVPAETHESRTNSPTKKTVDKGLLLDPIE